MNAAVLLTYRVGADGGCVEGEDDVYFVIFALF